jgi:hypothetical protein
MPPASVSPARLSSLSTSVLQRILELTRLRGVPDGPAPPATLSRRIVADLASLYDGIRALQTDPARQQRRSTALAPRDADAEAREEMLEGLAKQYGRLVGLASDLGLEPQELPTEADEPADAPCVRFGPA